MKLALNTGGPASAAAAVAATSDTGIHLLFVEGDEDTAAGLHVLVNVLSYEDHVASVKARPCAPCPTGMGPRQTNKLHLTWLACVQLKFVHADAWDAQLPDDATAFLECGRTFGQHITCYPSSAIPVNQGLLRSVAGHAVSAGAHAARCARACTT